MRRVLEVGERKRMWSMSGRDSLRSPRADKFGRGNGLLPSHLPGRLRQLQRLTALAAWSTPAKPLRLAPRQLRAEILRRLVLADSITEQELLDPQEDENEYDEYIDAEDDHVDAEQVDDRSDHPEFFDEVEASDASQYRDLVEDRVLRSILMMIRFVR